MERWEGIGVEGQPVVGLTFWGWIWGVTGALIAVPLMVILKILCDHSERLAPVGEFLGS